MTQLEKFKKFRDNELSKLAGGRKGHYILKEEVCKAIVDASPFLDINDLGKVAGIKKGGKNFELYGKAIYDYFTKSSNF